MSSPKAKGRGLGVAEAVAQPAGRPEVGGVAVVQSPAALLLSAWMSVGCQTAAGQSVYSVSVASLASSQLGFIGLNLLGSGHFNSEPMHLLSLFWDVRDLSETLY